MARRNLVYSEGARRPAAPVAGAIDVTEPAAGHFRVRLGQDTVAVAVRVWFGPPLDPITGEELDRGWRWQATANGEPVELERVWPACAKQPIAEAEYRRIIAQRDWARDHAPNSAFAERGRRIDRLSPDNPLPF